MLPLVLGCLIIIIAFFFFFNPLLYLFHAELLPSQYLISVQERWGMWFPLAIDRHLSLL